MIDANAEIQRLRQRLRFKNLSEFVIDQICDEISVAINNVTSELLANALEEAVSAGTDARSEDFINEIRAVRSGSVFNIVTDSGKTDFSEPPFPMLPRLLKNAEVAKDGSLYKVIPMKQKSGEYNSSNMAKTTEAAYSNIEKARNAARNNKVTNNNRIISSPDALHGMDTVAAMQAISKHRQAGNNNNRVNASEPAVEFRTASSKQDASSQWVRPGKKVDMGPALTSINSNLHDSIDRAILDIINTYEGLY